MILCETSPLADWLRSELKDLTYYYFFSKDAGLTYFFQYGQLQKLWDDHQTGKRNYGSILWSLLMFELWHKEFIGKQSAPYLNIRIT